MLLRQGPNGANPLRALAMLLAQTKLPPAVECLQRGGGAQLGHGPLPTPQRGNVSTL